MPDLSFLELEVENLKPNIISEKIFRSLQKHGWSSLPKCRYVVLTMFEVRSNDYSHAIEEEDVERSIIFAIQHINMNLFQPIGCLFYKKRVDPKLIAEAIEHYINDLVKCELFVLATLSNVSLRIKSAIDILIGKSNQSLTDTTYESLSYRVANMDIVHLFDPVSLIEETRDYFLCHNIQFQIFEQTVFGRITDISTMLNTGCGSERLRTKFVNHKPDSVDFALTIFSLSSFKGILKATTAGYLPRVGTKETLSTFDLAFDTLNSDEDLLKLNRNPVTKHSPHFKSWKSITNSIKSMKLIRNNTRLDLALRAMMALLKMSFKESMKVIKDHLAEVTITDNLYNVNGNFKTPHGVLKLKSDIVSVLTNNVEMVSVVLEQNGVERELLVEDRNLFLLDLLDKEIDEVSSKSLKTTESGSDSDEDRKCLDKILLENPLILRPKMLNEVTDEAMEVLYISEDDVENNKEIQFMNESEIDLDMFIKNGIETYMLKDTTEKDRESEDFSDLLLFNHNEHKQNVKASQENDTVNNEKVNQKATIGKKAEKKNIPKRTYRKGRKTIQNSKSKKELKSKKSDGVIKNTNSFNEEPMNFNILPHDNDNKENETTLEIKSGQAVEDNHSCIEKDINNVSNIEKASNFECLFIMKAKNPNNYLLDGRTANNKNSLDISSRDNYIVAIINPSINEVISEEKLITVYTGKMKINEKISFDPKQKMSLLHDVTKDDYIMVFKNPEDVNINKKDKMKESKEKQENDKESCGVLINLIEDDYELEINVGLSQKPNGKQKVYAKKHFCTDMQKFISSPDIILEDQGSENEDADDFTFSIIETRHTILGKTKIPIRIIQIPGFKSNSYYNKIFLRASEVMKTHHTQVDLYLTNTFLNLSNFVNHLLPQKIESAIISTLSSWVSVIEDVQVKETFLSFSTNLQVAIKMIQAKEEEKMTKTETIAKFNKLFLNQSDQNYAPLKYMPLGITGWANSCKGMAKLYENLVRKRLVMLKTGNLNLDTTKHLLQIAKVWHNICENEIPDRNKSVFIDTDLLVHAFTINSATVI